VPNATATATDASSIDDTDYYGNFIDARNFVD
jgi:hypothetical protein